MNNENNLSLREKAELTWLRERPRLEGSRLLRQAKKLEKVHEKLTMILGSDYEIELSINSKGDIIALVEDIQFITYNYDDDLLHIVPIVRCPLCEKSVSLGFINDLAALGEKLQLLESGYRHVCAFGNIV